MEIKEIWTEFKSRITSPFFGSFVLSWLVWNWRVPIVLIFYKQEDLITTGTTYIDVIQRYTGFFVSLMFPVISAFIYTFGYPFFKRWINIYIANQTNITEKVLLEISDAKTVPLNKFLNQKADLKRKENDLHVLIIEEEEVRNKNVSLLSQLSIKESDMAKLISDHSENKAEMKKAEEDRIVDLKSTYDNRIRNMMEDAEDKERIIRSSYISQIDTKEIEIKELSSALNIQKGILDKANENIEQLRSQTEELNNSINSWRKSYEDMDLMAKQLSDEIKKINFDKNNLIVTINEIVKNNQNYYKQVESIAKTSISDPDLNRSTLGQKLNEIREISSAQIDKFDRYNLI